MRIVTWGCPPRRNLQRCLYDAESEEHMSKVLKWGNSRGVLLPLYVTTALGLKVNDEVIVSLDTESRQIVIAPKNQDGIQEQYFAKASVVAKAAKAQDRW